jgi:hypothetical protein
MPEKNILNPQDAREVGKTLNNQAGSTSESLSARRAISGNRARRLSSGTHHLSFPVP